MPDTPINLTNANLDSVLNGVKPVLILFTSGEGLRGDFKVAFDKAAQEGDGKIVYAKANPRDLPDVAQRFGVGEKPVLIAWYCGEEVARRLKPWGTDLPLAVELLQKALPTDSPSAASPTDNPIEAQDQTKTEEEENPVT